WEWAREAGGEFSQKGMKGLYKPKPKPAAITGPQGYHGLVLVPDAVERTPPFVDDVLPNSPAAKAGLRPDDLIVYVNAEKITSIKELRRLIDKAQPGTSFKLEVRRGDRLVGLDLKLEALPVKAGRPKR